VVAFQVAAPVQHDHVDGVPCAVHTLDEGECLIRLTDRGKNLKIVDGGEQGVQSVSK
jgi:hypothetical protein